MADHDRSQLLLELTNAVTSQLDLNDLLHTISRLLRENVPHHYASVTLWDEDARQLRRHALVFPEGRGLLQDGDMVREGSPGDLVYRSGVTRCFSWADIEAMGDPTRRVMAAEGLRSVCSVPLQTPRGRHGALNVARPDDTPFPDAEVRLLEQIASQLAIAIENALHFQQAQRYREDASKQRDRLKLLLDLANKLASDVQLSTLMRTISDALRVVFPHDYFSVVLWDEEARQLRRHIVSFPDGSGPGEGTVVDAGFPAHRVFTSGTQVFRWADVESLGPRVADVIVTFGLRSGVGVPLQTARGRHGALIVGRREDRNVEPDEVALLEQIGRQLAIAIENALAFQQISELKDRLAEEKLYLEDEITDRQDFKGITGTSRALQEVLAQVRTVAPTDATVLLLGETGTGKEVLARAIHDTSKRRQKTFVRVNAAAIPVALFESELFGYERGAFTGASDTKLGRLELAHRGTLFLDEIGDLPIELQPKILRALQEQEFERLGSTRTQHVDVRLVAATNRRLDEMVAAGTFRSDLYYRLSVFPIQLPPLRDRTDDIAPLVRHFVERFSREMGRTISNIPAATMSALEQWPWPGNIRELQNVIERAVILSTGPSLHVPKSAFQRVPAIRAAAATTRSYKDAERETILGALRDANGVIGGADGAASRLGLKRTTLQSKIRRLGIERPSY